MKNIIFICKKMKNIIFIFLTFFFITSYSQKGFEFGDQVYYYNFGGAIYGLNLNSVDFYQDLTVYKYIDFEDNTLGLNGYDSIQIVSDFSGIPAYVWSQDKLTPPPGIVYGTGANTSKVMQWTFLEGEYYDVSVDGRDNYTIISDELSNKDTLWMSANVYFPEDFRAVQGGKFFGGAAVTGWSLGGEASKIITMWKEENEVVMYFKDENSPGGVSETQAWSDNGGRSFLHPGSWHNVTLQIVMNTGYNEDGILRGWLDGVLRYEDTQMYWRDGSTPDIHWDILRVNGWYGGSTADWGCQNDSAKILTDDIIFFNWKQEPTIGFGETLPLDNMKTTPYTPVTKIGAYVTTTGAAWVRLIANTDLVADSVNDTDDGWYYGWSNKQPWEIDTIAIRNSNYSAGSVYITVDSISVGDSVWGVTASDMCWDNGVWGYGSKTCPAADNRNYASGYFLIDVNLSSDATYAGYNTIFSDTTSIAQLRAMPVVIGNEGYYDSIFVYFDNAGDSVVLGVYDNSVSDTPSDLLAYTTKTSISSGWNGFDLNTDVYGTLGDTLWIGWLLKGNHASTLRYTAGTPGRYAADSYDWSTGLNDPFGSGTQAGYVYSMYLKYYGTSPSATGIPNDKVLAAFPDAAGFGTDSNGAYDGSSDPTILTVDTLYAGSLQTDTYSGSLEWCLSQTYPRIILFEVGGVIDYSPTTTRIVYVDDDYLSIYGQTAPSPGITLKSVQLDFSCTNVLIQYMAFRYGGYLLPDGTSPQPDAISFAASCSDIVLDHVSISWSIDELIGLYADNFTLSNSMIYHPLHYSHHVNEAGAHEPESHGYGPLWASVNNVTFYNNYIGWCTDRTPLASVDTCTFINNYSYYYGANPSYFNNTGNSAWVFAGNNLYPTPGRSSNTQIWDLITIPNASLTPSNLTLILTNDQGCINCDNGDTLYGIVNTAGTSGTFYSNNVSNDLNNSPVDLSAYNIIAHDSVLNYLKTYAGMRPWDVDFYDSIAWDIFVADTQDYINAPYALPAMAYNKSIYNDANGYWTNVYGTAGSMSSGYDFGSDNVSFTVNGTSIDLTVNCPTQDSVLNYINSQLPAGTEAKDHPHALSQHIIIQTTTTGSTESLVIGGDASVFGIPNGTYYGSDSPYPSYSYTSTRQVLSIPSNPNLDQDGDGWTNLQEWVYEISDMDNDFTVTY